MSEVVAEVKSLTNNFLSDDALSFMRLVHASYGSSHLMSEIYEDIFKHGKNDKPFFLNGEAGTGKELLARAIHLVSGREGAFVSLNMFSIPSNFIEGELFGNSTAQNPGLYEQSRGGTLFLEGVEDLPQTIQRSIIETLKEREHKVFFGNRAFDSVPPLLIFSSRQMVQADKVGFIREYTMDSGGRHLSIPSLRERIEDIPVIASYYLNNFAQSLGRRMRFKREAIALLQEYSWPGNIHELTNVIQRVASHVAADEVTLQELREHMPKAPDFAQSFCLPELADACLASYFKTLKGVAPAPKLHSKIMSEVEKPLIEHVLKYARGNQVRAADILGINRNTLRKKITELNIDIKSIS